MAIELQWFNSKEYSWVYFFNVIFFKKKPTILVVVMPKIVVHSYFNKKMVCMLVNCWRHASIPYLTRVSLHISYS
jgi:hypothetical protein